MATRRVSALATPLRDRRNFHGKKRHIVKLYNPSREWISKNSLLSVIGNSVRITNVAFERDFVVLEFRNETDKNLFVKNYDIITFPEGFRLFVSKQINVSQVLKAHEQVFDDAFSIILKNNYNAQTASLDLSYLSKKFRDLLRDYPEVDARLEKVIEFRERVFVNSLLLWIDKYIGAQSVASINFASNRIVKLSHFSALSGFNNLRSLVFLSNRLEKNTDWSVLRGTNLMYLDIRENPCFSEDVRGRVIQSIQAIFPQIVIEQSITPVAFMNASRKISAPDNVDENWTRDFVLRFVMAFQRNASGFVKSFSEFGTFSLYIDPAVMNERNLNLSPNPYTARGFQEISKLVHTLKVNMGSKADKRLKIELVQTPVPDLYLARVIGTGLQFDAHNKRSKGARRYSYSFSFTLYGKGENDMVIENVSFSIFNR